MGGASHKPLQALISLISERERHTHRERERERDTHTHREGERERDTHTQTHTGACILYVTYVTRLAARTTIWAGY